MSYALRPYSIAGSIPVPTAAGVSTPRMAAYSLNDPARGMKGLGFIDLLASVAGTAIGGFFGDKSQSREINAAKEIAQLNASAQMEIARLNAHQQTKAIEAAKETARIQAANELQAINAAYAAQLSAMRVQKKVASEQLSAQLVAGTQSGIFGLASAGLAEAGSTMRSIPRSGTIAAIAIVGITVLALSWKSRGRKGGDRKTERRQEREQERPPASDFLTPYTETE